MKRMQYIVLLSILLGTISMHAGRGAVGIKRPMLWFPQARVHRYLRNPAQIQMEIELAQKRERALIARTKALAEAEKQIKDVYEQVDKKATEMLATIDASTLKNINLEGLD